MSVSVKDYPLVACLHPRVVHAHGQRIVVGCGHCEACITAKAQRNSLKLQLEQKKHLYSVFLTLTYNEESVPKYDVEADSVYVRYCCAENGYQHQVRKVTDYYLTVRNERLKPYCDDVCFSDVDGTYTKWLNDYWQKQKDYDSLHLSSTPSYDGTVRVASVRDVQLFFKRLRQRIYRKFNEKIRYYIVSEYGPQSLRPHFHCLLFTDSLEVANLLRGDRFYKKVGQRTLYESSYLSDEVWKFGCVVSERANGDAFSYLSSYVNSAALLPHILKEDFSKPFSTHSNALGEKLAICDAKDIYEMPFESVVSEVSSSNTSQFVFNRWSSYIRKFFPKCPRYSMFDSHLRRYVYKIYPKLQRLSIQVTGEKSTCVGLAHLLISVSLGCVPDDCSYDEIMYLRNIVSECRDVFPSRQFLDGLTSPHSYETVFRSVYLSLLVSKRVALLADLCGVSIDDYITHIQNFYDYCERTNLTKLYEKLENGDVNPYVYYRSCECENFAWLNDTDEYRFLVGAAHVNFYGSIKHKEVKDVFSFANK